MRAVFVLSIIISSILIVEITECSDICKEETSGIPSRRSYDNVFTIDIQGKPKSYTANQVYNVTLKAIDEETPTFKKFSLRLLASTAQPVGRFYIGQNSQVVARISSNCPNTVVQRGLVEKKDIQVFWYAPPPGSGCVSILGTVIVSEEKWYSETGYLNKTLCEEEESQNDEKVQPPRMLKCCACSEAKYEVAFEGKWTKNTHPKGYPQDIWDTKFSDIIGASHQRLHSFWYERQEPSSGLQILAYNGSTEELQKEIINDQGQYIRTLIKAKGLQHPYLTQSSYSAFRVDQENHRISLVSKIMPSPDWIVGVSDFELCALNGTWIEYYSYNLYPFDVGIDNGVTYTDRIPRTRDEREPIITPMNQYNPNDSESPFFSETGDEINPLARLHFRRQRIYERECDSSCEEIEETN